MTTRTGIKEVTRYAVHTLGSNICENIGSAKKDIESLRLILGDLTTYLSKEDNETLMNMEESLTTCYDQMLQMSSDLTVKYYNREQHGEK